MNSNLTQEHSLARKVTVITLGVLASCVVVTSLGVLIGGCKGNRVGDISVDAHKDAEKPPAQAEEPQE